MKRVNVSIVIVNFNTKKLVDNCIDSIIGNTFGVEYEIVVVDNASTDGSQEQFRNDKRIIFVRSETNLGFGKANNLAVKYCSGDFFLFLNPDTLLINNAIERMFGFLCNNSKVGSVGGNLYDIDLKPHHSFSRLYPSMFREIDFACRRIFTTFLFKKNVEFNYTSKPLKVAFVTGADLMISRKVWEKSGGFDRDFFMYCEESDLQYRIHKMGYEIYNIPNAKIIHLEGRSFKLNYARERIMIDGRFVYFYKHYGKLYNRVANIINLLMYKVAIFFYKYKDVSLYNKYKVRLEIYTDMMKKYH